MLCALCLSQVPIDIPSTSSTTKTQHPQHIISSTPCRIRLSLTGLRRMAACSGESRDGARESSHHKTLIVFVSILGLGFDLWCGPMLHRFKNPIWVMGLITILATLPAFFLNFNEYIDCWLRALPVTTNGIRHGNVEVCDSDLIIPSATSLCFILPSVSLQQLPPTKSTILVRSVFKSSMVWEKKIVSTASTSCLSIVLLSGSFEIHLVSRVNIVGSRADLYMAKTFEFSLRFLSDISTLVRAISGNLQSKEIIGTVGSVGSIRSISSGFALVSFLLFASLENSKDHGLVKVALQTHLSL